MPKCPFCNKNLLIKESFSWVRDFSCDCFDYYIYREKESGDIEIYLRNEYLYISYYFGRVNLRSIKINPVSHLYDISCYIKEINSIELFVDFIKNDLYKVYLAFQ